MDTRGRILGAALSCFVDAGYEQTTIARRTHPRDRQALARRAGNRPLRGYQAHLTDAATAALSGTPAPSRRPRPAGPRHGQLRLRVTADDGGLIAEGEATIELQSAVPGTD